MVIERIKQFIEAKGLNNSAFEKMVGLSNASIANALNRKGAIGSDKLENILIVFPELNPTWLMTGKGEMFGGTSALEQEVERLREENRRLREIRIPAADVAPMAEVWLKFMDNQRQYNEIMNEMVELYKKTK